ncbi:MAG: helix-turn-helix transcriptional regulator [Labilithrix sp.]
MLALRSDLSCMGDPASRYTHLVAMVAAVLSSDAVTLTRRSEPRSGPRVVGAPRDVASSVLLAAHVEEGARTDPLHDEPGEGWTHARLAIDGETTVILSARRRARPFSEMETHLLATIHESCAFVYEAREPMTPKLRPRQREALECLMTGASDKEIAVALGLSTYTASQYVREILRLHGVSSRQQLMAKLYAGSVHASVGGVGVTPRARVGS